MLTLSCCGVAYRMGCVRKFWGRGDDRHVDAGSTEAPLLLLAVPTDHPATTATSSTPLDAAGSRKTPLLAAVAHAAASTDTSATAPAATSSPQPQGMNA
eukprot:1295248-Amphidinium_carterae.1